MAVIEIGVKGGNVQMGEVRDKIVDSLNAVRSGIVEGLVPGGGVVYLYASRRMKLSEKQGELGAGYRILKEALEAPFFTLLRHSGVGESVVEELMEKKNEDYGVDVLTGQVCDLVQTGIVDSTRVVRQSLQTACSLAGMILTTEAAIVRLRRYTPASLQSYRKKMF